MKLCLNAVKFLLLLCLAFFITKQLSTASVSDIDFSSVENVLTASLNRASMKKADERLLKRLYGFDRSALEEYVLYLPANNMEAEEFLLIKTSTPEQLNFIERSVNKRIKTQLQSFEGYAAEQTRLIQEHRISIIRNYLLFTVSSDSEILHDLFKKSLR